MAGGKHSPYKKRSPIQWSQIGKYGRTHNFLLGEAPLQTLQLHLPFVYKHCSFLLPLSHLSTTHLDDIANVGTGSTSTFYSHVIRHIDGR